MNKEKKAKFPLNTSKSSITNPLVSVITYLWLCVSIFSSFSSSLVRKKKKKKTQESIFIGWGHFFGHSCTQVIFTSICLIFFFVFFDYRSIKLIVIHAFQRTAHIIRNHRKITIYSSYENTRQQQQEKLITTNAINNWNNLPL